MHKHAAPEPMHGRCHVLFLISIVVYHSEICERLVSDTNHVIDFFFIIISFRNSGIQSSTNVNKCTSNSRSNNRFERARFIGGWSVIVRIKIIVIGVIVMFNIRSFHLQVKFTFCILHSLVICPLWFFG